MSCGNVRFVGVTNVTGVAHVTFLLYPLEMSILARIIQFHR